MCVHAMVSKDDYMSTDNLEKGYWQICLNPTFKKYIGVSLDGRFYVVNILILGICDAVFAFTNLVKTKTASQISKMLTFTT